MQDKDKILIYLHYWFITLFDFWLMVYEQGSEVIVMLSSEIESQDTKVSINRGQKSL
jgi:protein tyrosine phosphatase